MGIGGERKKSTVILWSIWQTLKSISKLEPTSMYGTCINVQIWKWFGIEGSNKISCFSLCSFFCWKQL